MALLRLTAPAAEPVTLALARQWLRLDGTDEDALVTALIEVAREAVEAAARLRLVAQGWRWLRDDWPPGPLLRVPIGPLRAVNAVRVRDRAGNVTTVPAADLAVETVSRPGRIALLGAVPAPRLPCNGIEIDLTVGVAATAAECPAALRQAILITLAQLFENRGDAPTELSLVPPAALALLAPWRMGRP